MQMAVYEPLKYIRPDQPEFVLEPRHFFNLPPEAAVLKWRKAFNRSAEKDPVNTRHYTAQYFADFPKGDIGQTPTAQNLRLFMGNTLMNHLAGMSLHHYPTVAPSLASRVIFACDLEKEGDLHLWRRGVDVLARRSEYAEAHGQVEVRGVIMETMDTIMSRVRSRRAATDRGLPRGVK